MLCGHSFRAGIPSALAANPNAVSDMDIKNWGRWTSDSYLVYTRLKLKQKCALYSKILKVLNKSLERNLSVKFYFDWNYFVNSHRVSR
jgi:hypothetical protein